MTNYKINLVSNPSENTFIINCENRVISVDIETPSKSKTLSGEKLTRDILNEITSQVETYISQQIATQQANADLVRRDQQTFVNEKINNIANALSWYEEEYFEVILDEQAHALALYLDNLSSDERINNLKNSIKTDVIRVIKIDTESQE